MSSFDLTILSSKVNGSFNDSINHGIATYPVKLCERIDGNKYQEWYIQKGQRKHVFLFQIMFIAIFF